VIVGQARSGSTLITRLMADTGHFFLVNDAYFLQMADDLCPRPDPTRDERLRLARACLERMRQRALTEEVGTVNRSVPLSAGQFEALEAALPDIAGRAATAWEVIFRLMEHAAGLAQAPVWGWNSPQDYVHAGRLIEELPGSRILFLIRDPYSVLKSYKNLPGYWGAERNRYHPLVQSMVWMSVVREYRRLEALHPGRVALLRYEDLTAPGTNVWAGLTALLGDFPRPKPASSYDRNSSHGRAAPRPLGGAEIGICRAVTASLAGDMGYQPPGSAQALGLMDLGRSTARVLGFYASRAVRSRDMRRRLVHFGARLRQRTQ
jgi:hypothetical protein